MPSLDVERKNRYGKSDAESRHHRCGLSGQRQRSAGMYPEYFDDADLALGGCRLWFPL